MFSIRVLVLPLAVLLTSSHSYGQDFRVGESVIVSTESADVMTMQQKLGSIPHGTKFKIQQINTTWLLGEFRIGNRTVTGWVRQKVVRRTTIDPTEEKPYDFNWENLVIARVKLEKDFHFEGYVDDYLEAFRRTEWKRIRKDEFQLQKKRPEALRVFRQRVAELDLNRYFIIHANLTIGEFDFTRSAFPIEEATDEHYWYEHLYVSTKFPHAVKVYLTNPELIAHVPMSADAAERFLSRRKDKRGEIDRKIFAKMYILVRSMKNDDDELLSDLGWAQFFSDSKHTKLLYETPKPPPAAPATGEVPASTEPPKSDFDTSGDETDVDKTGE